MRYYDKVPRLVVTLPQELGDIIGERDIFITEFVMAKVRGKISELQGHPEIGDEIFLRLPESLSFPGKILKDTRSKQTYLFIVQEPLHQIVVEVCRVESGKTEINTIHYINLRELKRLEKKFPVVYSVGGAPTSSSSRSQQGRLSGVN